MDAASQIVSWEHVNVTNYGVFVAQTVARTVLITVTTELSDNKMVYTLTCDHELLTGHINKASMTLLKALEGKN